MKKILICIVFILFVSTTPQKVTMIMDFSNVHTTPQKVTMIMDFSNEVLAFPSNPDGSFAGVRIPVMKMDSSLGKYFACTLYSKHGKIEGNFIMEYTVNRGNTDPIGFAVIYGINNKRYHRFTWSHTTFLVDGEKVKRINIEPRTPPKRK